MYELEAISAASAVWFYIGWTIRGAHEYKKRYPLTHGGGNNGLRN